MITGLLLEPLSRLRAAARRLSDGHYNEQIAPPYPPELVELADDLNELAARLSDIETRRARLVSDLAHELRTPLTIIEGQLVGVSDGVYDFSGELVGSVREELGRLRRLTEDLSGLSRAEENAYQLNAVPAELAALVVRLTDLMRPQFDHRDVQLDVICVPVVAVVDPDRVTQILANLLSNALTATPGGGRVQVSLHARDAHAAIEVSDTGHGITAADLNRIFERFERVIPAHDQADVGSGIGLTIARALARAHGGEVAARSPGRDQGATFTLSLPLPPPPLKDTARP
jgi:signal transduction histidine kinase